MSSARTPRLRFRLGFFLVIALLSITLPARAQSPQAGKYDDQTLSVGGVFNDTHLQYGEHWVYGAGAFVDANLTWHYGIEGEATWSRWHEQSDTYATTYLIGPRYRFAALGNDRFAPYAKFLIGDGAFNFPYSYGYGNYFVMAPGGGVDYHWKPRFDIRLCDVEYQMWPQFTFGSVANVSISAGLRFRVF